MPRTVFSRRVRRLVGWNAGLALVGLALVAAGGETWFRLTAPFGTNHAPRRFVPRAGHLLQPDTEVRATNMADFWAVSRTNSLGFADREPPPPASAAAGCHVTVIGDSFVEAQDVPIAAKVQVRLEELAARRLPRLRVTTSAFGLRATGQVGQIPFYDEFARHLHPRLAVLVFVDNDFLENSPLLSSMLFPGHHPSPETVTTAFAERAADGAIRLRPPSPPAPERPRRAGGNSWLLAWMRLQWARHPFRVWLIRQWMTYPFIRQARHLVLGAPETTPAWLAYAERLSRRPRYASAVEDLQSARYRPPTGNGEENGAEILGPGSFYTTAWGVRGNILRAVLEEDPKPVFQDALDFTAFALDEFKARADRDGAALVVLTTYSIGSRNSRAFVVLDDLARARGIPVLNQHDHIVRAGADPRDARWPHDGHWSPAGHRWAAEMLVEHLERNPAVCGRGAADGDGATGAGRSLREAGGEETAGAGPVPAAGAGSASRRARRAGAASGPGRTRDAGRRALRRSASRAARP